jgi:hypothetical protein
MYMAAHGNTRGCNSPRGKAMGCICPHVGTRGGCSLPHTLTSSESRMPPHFMPCSIKGFNFEAIRLAAGPEIRPSPCFFMERAFLLGGAKYSFSDMLSLLTRSALHSQYDYMGNTIMMFGCSIHNTKYTMMKWIGRGRHKFGGGLHELEVTMSQTGHIVKLTCHALYIGDYTT